MANLASALKEEIGRLARKEIRQQTAGMARTVAQCQRDIAALKGQIEDLKRKLASARTTGASAPTATTKAPARKAATKKPAAKATSGSGKQSARTRFSATGLKTSRERLGLSADNYGKLIGVSGLSIYNWEQEKARPRESSITALNSIKGIGKREAARRLAELVESKPEENTTEARTKARTKTKAKAKAKTKAKAKQAATPGKATGEDQAGDAG